MKQESNTHQWLPICIGGLFILFGVLLLGLGIVALIDPVGTKMADDSDPFGTPTSFVESLFGTIASVAVICFGIWLVSKSKKKT